MMYGNVISIEEIKKLQQKETVLLVDIREKKNFDAGHIPNAISVPYSEKKSFLASFQKTGIIVLCCDRGNLSTRVMMRMRKAGYRAYSLAGGYEGYLRLKK